MGTICTPSKAGMLVLYSTRDLQAPGSIDQLVTQESTVLHSTDVAERKILSTEQRNERNVMLYLKPGE